MVLCIIVGCGNKSGKSSQKKDSAVKLSRVPKIVKNEGEMIERQKYSVLQSMLPIDYLLCSDKEGNQCCPMMDRLIRVCCALINLCPAVVPFD